MNPEPPRPRLLARVAFDAALLWQRHPPRLVHPNKCLVLEAAGGARRKPTGTLQVARYAAAPLPLSFPAPAPVLRSEPCAFDYPEPAPDSTEWHLNFADPQLFYAYGMAAFAQDEIQVAEHPILGSLLEALRTEAPPDLSPLTEESGRHARRAPGGSAPHHARTGRGRGD